MQGGRAQCCPSDLRDAGRAEGENDTAEQRARGFLRESFTLQGGTGLGTEKKRAIWIAAPDGSLFLEGRPAPARRAKCGGSCQLQPRSSLLVPMVLTC